MFNKIIYPFLTLFLNFRFQKFNFSETTSQESAEFCWHSTQFVKSALLQTRNNYFNSNLFWLKDSAGDVEDSKTQLSQFPFQLRTLKQEIWKKKFEKKIRKKKLVKMVADKKLRSSDKEEELLLQDFSRRVSAKSSALFYGNAFIVSGKTNIVCKEWLLFQTQFLRKQNCSKLLFF